MTNLVLPQQYYYTCLRAHVKWTIRAVSRASVCFNLKVDTPPFAATVASLQYYQVDPVLQLLGLTTLGLSKDIQCHALPHSFLCLQITVVDVGASEICCQPGDCGWPLKPSLCGYVLVNILTLSSLRSVSI